MMTYRFALYLTYSEPLKYKNHFPVMPEIKMPSHALLVSHAYGEAIVNVSAPTPTAAHEIINQILNENICLLSIDVMSYAVS